MIVRRIHVRQFRKLTDQVLECGPGLNVIRGPNDAGKSTLHRAFWAALFPVKPSEAQSFGPWGEERPGEIVLDFEADGRLYRLRKDFRTRRTTLDVDGQVREGKAVEAEIGRILGLSSPKLFRATVHIGQWELAAVQEEKEEIGPRLAQIVSGGDRDATRVLRQLNSDLTHLEVGLRRPAATPGPLRRAADDVARLVAERDRLQREVDAVERAAAERDRLAARCADLERQVADDDALLEANRQLLELDRRCEELGRRAGELQSLLERVDAAAREVEAAEGAEDLRIPLPDDRVVATLHDALLRVERLRGELSQAEEALHLALAARAPTSVPGLLSGLASRASVVLLAGAAAAAVAGGLALVLAGRPGWAGAGLFGIGGLLALLALLGGYLGRTLRAQAAKREEEARAAVDQRRRALTEAERTTGAMLVDLGVASPAELEERLQRARAARDRLAKAREVLQALLAGRTREALAEEYREVAVALAAARAARDAPDLALRRLDASGFHRLQQDAERRRRELDASREALRQVEFQLDGRAPQEELARVEEALAAAQERYARLQRRAAVLRLTRDVLDEAYRDTIVPGKAQLEARAGDYLRALSHGVYDRISVDDHTLAPRVWVGPPKEWADVTAREIGSGAVDQCYLALRLALVDLLCPDRKPPLFLDDPFLAYDEERQASALRLLRDLARDRQIFLFTCRRVYDGYADRLIVLGQRAAGEHSAAS
jgi:uncharacterized protein YhaN